MNDNTAYSIISNEDDRHAMPEDFKVLITDDDSDLRELLTEAVRNWGYAASVASDGDDALRRLKTERFDIVITDLMMPGMDGLTLLKRIKDLDKDILVIIITGYATIETAVKAIETGAYDYIAKPFRLDELMIVVKNACERLRLTAQNRALLDELRSANAEVARLRNILAQSGVKLPEKADLPGRIENVVFLPDKDGLGALRGQEYSREAERFSGKSGKPSDDDDKDR